MLTRKREKEKLACAKYRGTPPPFQGGENEKLGPPPPLGRKHKLGMLVYRENINYFSSIRSSDFPLHIPVTVL